VTELELAIDRVDRELFGLALVEVKCGARSFAPRVAGVELELALRYAYVLELAIAEVAMR